MIYYAINRRPHATGIILGRVGRRNNNAEQTEIFFFLRQPVMTVKSYNYFLNTIFVIKLECKGTCEIRDHRIFVQYWFNFSVFRIPALDVYHTLIFTLLFEWLVKWLSIRQKLIVHRKINHANLFLLKWNRFKTDCPSRHFLEY